MVFAGDISPIDVISHIPIICEESGISYCYVPSKQALGEAGATKRPTSVVLIPDTSKKGADYEETYDECVKEISGLPVVPAQLG